MKFSNEEYDILKWVCIVVMPALITLLGVVLPSVGVSVYVTQTVIKVIGAVATFIGALIGISCSNYNKETDNGDN